MLPLVITRYTYLTKEFACIDVCQILCMWMCVRGCLCVCVCVCVCVFVRVFLSVWPHHIGPSMQKLFSRRQIEVIFIKIHFNTNKYNRRYNNKVIL